MGVESLTELNLDRLIWKNNASIDLSLFFNFSTINSEYVRSEEPGIEGKKVEFIPTHNYKLGTRFGFRNFYTSLQLTSVGEQFSDASNAVEGTLSGVIGKIPSYQIIDLSANYLFGKFKIETGINNLANEVYFTRRATGYPGPGIIPSPPRNYYLTIQFKQ